MTDITRFRGTRHDAVDIYVDQVFGQASPEAQAVLIQLGQLCCQREDGTHSITPADIHFPGRVISDALDELVRLEMVIEHEPTAHGTRRFTSPMVQP